MSRGRRRKRRNTGAASVMVIVIAFLAVMSVQIYKLKQKDAEYAKKEATVQQQYEAETERSAEIENLGKYMQTPQYIEDMAKSKLGLAYDNEIIFKESDE